jgi:rubrerythrin
MLYAVRSCDDDQIEHRGGLSLFSTFDAEIVLRQHKADNCWACGTCGYLTKAAHPDGGCRECGAADWHGDARA